MKVYRRALTFLCILLSPAVLEAFAIGSRSATVCNPLKNIASLNNDFPNAEASVMKPLFTTGTELQMVPTTPEGDAIMEDPIDQLVEEVQVMNLDAIINTSAVVLIVLAVLNQIISVDAGMMRGWSADEMAVRIPVDNWISYSSVLEKTPLYTKAVTSAIVYTIGDFIAQRTEGNSMGELDRARLIRSLLAGLIGHGPLSHVWYDWSEHIFDHVLHLRDWWGTIAKVAIDQTTWGPFWNNTYILLLGLMKLDSFEKIFSEMKRTTIPLIVSGLKLWPLAHIVTYGLIPVENRLLWVDLVEIIWVTILASAAANGGEGGGAHGAPAVEEETTNKA